MKEEPSQHEYANTDAWTRRHPEPGHVDRSIKNKNIKHLKTCSKGHYNTDQAKICWKCGETLK